MSGLAETLQNEHVTIRDSLDLVGELVKALEGGQTVPAEDLNGVLDFMENFTDKNHRAKEEALFRDLVRSSEASVRPMIHRLEIEHAACRKIVAHLRELVPAVLAGEPRARLDFEMYLRSYRMRTLDHLRDETKELMPLLESGQHPDQGALRGPGALSGPEGNAAERVSNDHRLWIRTLMGKYSARSRTSG